MTRKAASVWLPRGRKSLVDGQMCWFHFLIMANDTTRDISYRHLAFLRTLVLKVWSGSQDKNHFHNGNGLFPLFTWSWMNAQRNFQRARGRDWGRLALETDSNLDGLFSSNERDLKRYNIYSDTLLFFILGNRFIYFYYILFLRVHARVHMCV